MYGLVNQAIRDLVVKLAGEPTWLAICKEAAVDINTFVAMDSYPDDLTYRLVAAVANAMDMEPGAVLREFGRHWIRYTATEGYGPLMDMFGENYFEALNNINQLHARIGLSMPHLSAPKFRIHKAGENGCLIEYISQRRGLGMMMVGLLEGLAEKHLADVTIERLPGDDADGHESFLVTRKV